MNIPTPVALHARSLAPLVRTRVFGMTPGKVKTARGRTPDAFDSGFKLDDFAIRRGDVEWVTRFLRHFPALGATCDTHGKPFKLLAEESGNQEIAELFGSSVRR